MFMTQSRNVWVEIPSFYELPRQLPSPGRPGKLFRGYVRVLGKGKVRWYVDVTEKVTVTFYAVPLDSTNSFFLSHWGPGVAPCGVHRVY